MTANGIGPMGIFQKAADRHHRCLAMLDSDACDNNAAAEESGKPPLLETGGKGRPPVRVFHLINDLGCGGAQTVILGMAKHLDRRRFRTCVGHWGTKWGHEMIDRFTDIGIDVIDLNGHSRFDVNAMKNLYRSLTSQTIDILHTHLFRMHIVGRIVGKLAGIPVILSTHHNLLEGNNRVTRLFEKITSPLSDITTSVSLAAQKSHYGTSEPFSIDALFSGRRHFTIFNAIDLNEVDKTLQRSDVGAVCREFGLENRFVFACIGRLHSCKGHQHLIEAVDLLKERCPSVTVLIAGDGPLRDELEDMVRTRKLTEEIRFLGYRKDVTQILAVCHAVVQPSVFEGFGLAAAEAMACGLPVVSTNLPSIAEVVEDGKTGILVSPGDSRALSMAMATIADNPELAAGYGAAGKMRVKTLFSSNVITRQYEQLYEAMVNIHNPPVC